jgi:hypothetical protein
LSGEFFFVLSACNGSRAKPHSGCVLHAQMTKSTDTEDGNEIARRRTAAAQGVESGQPGAHQRGDLPSWRTTVSAWKTGQKNPFVDRCAVILGEVLGYTDPQEKFSRNIVYLALTKGIHDS